MVEFVVDWSDFIFHLRILGNGLLTGALLGILIYRNVVLKWNTNRRWW